MIKLAITGCMGRMGQRIIELAQKDKEFQIVALIESPNRKDVPELTMGLPVFKDISMLKGADVLIDFTLPEATPSLLKACHEYKVRMVIGTTGLGAKENSQVEAISHDIAIVKSSNMSIGVNVVFGLLKKMAETLKGYNVSITETHHIHKKDAPSGTAKSMAEVVEAASGAKVQDVASVREGEVVGYHKVTFESPVDTIELSHNAKTRDMFAEGALVAAKFIAKKNSGLYNMQQVLGLI
ncbi:MAG: 4-hydroxy-tetrahydrodipicolinate reductase [Candidatus Omnitrophica bacterium]|nr:4-hydroxy-tetrahydrodipicolinate reductase [Candidatus Omnitrophota bacterium]